jgi:hypothetical protein
MARPTSGDELYALALMLEREYARGVLAGRAEDTTTGARLSTDTTTENLEEQ